ncbi:MAG: hypothetical protein AWU58_2059, partial [Methanohalophilus sp. T328-1]
SGSDDQSWSLFTFRKDSSLWNSLPVWEKVGIYVVDILNKGMKPFGYVYDSFPDFSHRLCFHFLKTFKLD